MPTNEEIDDTTRALASLSSYVASHEKSFMRDETSNEIASADKLVAEWKEQGNILITDKGRTTHTIRLGGKTPRVFHFRANIITIGTDSAEAQYYAELGAF